MSEINLIRELALKTCRVCNNDFPISEFWIDRSKADGRRSSCRKCDTARLRNWQKDNAEHVRTYSRQWQKDHPEKTSQSRRRHREKYRASCLVKSAKTRASQKGVPYDLDGHVEAIKTIIDSGRCQMTGLPFSMAAKRDWDSPSLDRIDPSKGYVWGNVRVICFGMNCALGTWGDVLLEKMISAWLSQKATSGIEPTFG